MKDMSVAYIGAIIIVLILGTIAIWTIPGWSLSGHLGLVTFYILSWATLVYVFGLETVDRVEHKHASKAEEIAKSDLKEMFKDAERTLNATQRQLDSVEALNKSQHAQLKELQDNVKREREGTQKQLERATMQVDELKERVRESRSPVRDEPVPTPPKKETPIKVKEERKGKNE